MFLERAEQTNLNFKTKLNHLQTKVISFSLLYAGLGFALICGFAFLFYYAIQNQWINFEQVNILYVVSSVLLIVAFIISIFISFANKFNIWWIYLIYFIFIFSFAISFGMLFTLFNGSEVLMLFGISGGVLLICSIIGFSLSNKGALTLSRIIYILLPLYFFGSLIFSLVSAFVFSSNSWYIIATILSTGIILCLNIYSFYNLSKSAEFVKMTDETKVPINKICLVNGLNILCSMVNTIMLVARILLFSRR